MRRSNSRSAKKSRTPARASPATRLCMNNSELKSIDLPLWATKCEFLYLRDNMLPNVFGLPSLLRLKVLDLSCNLISTLERFPELPMLKELFLSSNRIKSLEYLPRLPSLEVLSVSNCSLSSLAGIPPLPNLKALFLSDNNLTSFIGFPPVRHLESLRLDGNPLSANLWYQMAAALIAGPTLCKLDGKEVTPQERNQVLTYPRMLSSCLRMGMCLDEAVMASPIEFMTKGELRSSLLLTGVSLVPELSEKHVMQYQIKADCGPCRFVGGEIEGSAVEQELLTAHFHFDCPDHVHVHCDERASANNPHSLMGRYLYRWSRSSGGSYFVYIPQASQKDYFSCLEDVGCCLRVECWPVLPNGDIGPPYVLLSRDILSGPPQGRNLCISGRAEEDQLLRAHVDYFGGVEGMSSFRWFRSRELHGEQEEITPTSPDRDGTEEDLEEEDSACRELLLQYEDVGYHIHLCYVPVRNDGIQGSGLWSSIGPVVPVLPQAEGVKISGDQPVEGVAVRGHGQCVGKGSSCASIKWCRCIKMDQGEGMDGGVAEIDGARTKYRLQSIVGARELSYVPTVEDVGCRICLEFTPSDDRGYMGRAQRVFSGVVQPGLPRIESLEIGGRPEESQELKVVFKYFGGHLGRLDSEWYRVSHHVAGSVNPGELEELLAVNTEHYIPSVDDIGYHVAVRCLPFRSDGIRGPPAVVCTSQSISAAMPRVEGLEFVGTAVEGCELICRHRYIGGEEGSSSASWFREAESPDGRSKEGGQWTLVSQSDHQLAYFPSGEDVGHRLMFQYVPRRADRAEGEPVRLFSEVVAAAQPVAENLRIERESLQLNGYPILSAAYDYKGGCEGESITSWMCVSGGVGTEDEHHSPRESGSDGRYVTGEHDRGKRMFFSCTPVRSDGTVGTCVTSARTECIDPVLPNIVAVVVEGIAVEGERLTCRAQGEDFSVDCSLVTWERSSSFSGQGQAEVYDISSTKGSWDYSTTLDDVDHEVRAVVTPVAADGRVGKAAVSEAVRVAPGSPVCSKLQTSASVSPVLHRSVVVAEATYWGGREGDSEYSWARKKCNADDTGGTYEPISGNKLSQYRCSVEDIGYCLKVVYTPVRDDGKKGDPCEATTSVVVPDPALEKALSENLMRKRATFHIPYPDERSLALTSEGLELRDESDDSINDEADSVLYSGRYSPSLQMCLDPTDACGLTLTDGQAHFILSAASSEERDVIMATTLAFARLSK